MADDDNDSAALTELNAAAKMLDAVATPDDALDLVNRAAVAEIYANRAKYGTRAANAACTIRLLALLKLRQLVDEGQERGEIAARGGDRSKLPGGEFAPRTLADLGISNHMLSDMTTLAAAFVRGELEAKRDAADAKDQPLNYSRIVTEARFINASQRRDREAIEDDAYVAANPPNCELIHGDFRDVLDARGLAGQVDAIVTDPPYPREFMHLLPSLAALADRLLKPDGVLVIMYGHQALPEALQLLHGGRPYRWTACYLMPGPNAVHHPARVSIGWKPLLIYGGGPRFHDVITAEHPDDQRYHYWGQSLDGMTRIVETFTRPGMLVVDPFLGGGTTGMACLSTRRAFIGCDVDAEAVDTARVRLTAAHGVDPLAGMDEAHADAYGDDDLPKLGTVLPFHREDGERDG